MWPKAADDAPNAANVGGKKPPTAAESSDLRFAASPEWKQRGNLKRIVLFLILIKRFRRVNHTGITGIHDPVGTEGRRNIACDLWIRRSMLYLSGRLAVFRRPAFATFPPHLINWGSITLK